MAAVPPTQNCLNVVFMDPGNKTGYTVRFPEQLVVPFGSDIVTVYSPAILISMSLVEAVKPDGPVHE